MIKVNRLLLASLMLGTMGFAKGKGLILSGQYLDQKIEDASLDKGWGMIIVEYCMTYKPV